MLTLDWTSNLIVFNSKGSQQVDLSDDSLNTCFARFCLNSFYLYLFFYSLKPNQFHDTYNKPNGFRDLRDIHTKSGSENISPKYFICKRFSDFLIFSYLFQHVV